MTTLFPHLPFHVDETPISWIGRLAELHTGGSVYAFSNDLGFSLSAVQLGDIETIHRICEIAGQDPEPVLRNTATSDGDSLYTLRGEQFPAMMLTREETRF